MTAAGVKPAPAPTNAEMWAKAVEQFNQHNPFFFTKPDGTSDFTPDVDEFMARGLRAQLNGEEDPTAVGADEERVYGRGEQNAEELESRNRDTSGNRGYSDGKYTYYGRGAQNADALDNRFSDKAQEQGQKRLNEWKTENRLRDAVRVIGQTDTEGTIRKDFYSDLRQIFEQARDAISQLYPDYIEDKKAQLSPGGNLFDSRTARGKALDIVFRMISIGNTVGINFHNTVNSGDILLNYISNSEIDEKNLKNGYIGEGIYINGQGRDPYSSYSFDRGNFAGNGCMAIAVYNSLISLGEFEKPADIETELELRGGMLGDGFLGGNPSAAYEYFALRDYDVDTAYYPTQEELEAIVRSSDTTIVLYAHKDGMHYVTVGYSDEPGEYRIYNNSNDDRVGNEIDDLFKGVYLPIVVYSINKPGDEEK